MPRVRAIEKLLPDAFLKQNASSALWDDKVVLSCTVQALDILTKEFLFTCCPNVNVACHQLFFFREISDKVADGVQVAHHDIEGGVIKDVNVSFVASQTTDYEWSLEVLFFANEVGIKHKAILSERKE